MSLHLWDLELLSVWLSLWPDTGPTIGDKSIFGGPMAQQGAFLPYPTALFEFYCYEADATSIADAYALLSDPVEQESFRTNLMDQVYGGHWGDLPSQLA